MNNPSVAPTVSSNPAPASVPPQQTCTCTAPATPAPKPATGTAPAAPKAARIRKPRVGHTH